MSTCWIANQLARITDRAAEYCHESTVCHALFCLLGFLETEDSLFYTRMTKCAEMNNVQRMGS